MVPRFAARCVLLSCGLALAAAVHAQGRYPEKPVKVLGGNVGGLPDTVARLVSQKLSEMWGQPVINENRQSSAGTLLAAEALAKSAPDGYTLLVSDAQTLLIHPVIYEKLPYSPKDLMPVALAAQAPLFLAVQRSLPVNNLQDLIALAKAQPGKLNYGSSGIGSTHQLSMEYIKLELGLDIVHVPYKGTSQSVPALLGGQVQMVFSAYPSLATHARAGTVKLIAANSLRRASFAPDVPTVAELAIPGYDFSPPIGFIAPAGIPKDIAYKIAADVARAVKQPDVSGKMIALGIEPIGGNPEEYAARLRADGERYVKVLKAAGIKPE
jgi:tripartite-type tricarboxylate transporter receptor subunit TctC